MRSFITLALSALIPLTSPAQSDVEKVKSYLVTNIVIVKKASEDFVKNANAYATLVDSQNNDYEKVANHKPEEAIRLVKAMQENYKAMDSFGYETVEGIVAGVGSLADYDVYLDAGVPDGQGNPEEIAPVVLVLKDGSKIDKKGALFTFIIEPALWGNDFSVKVDSNGLKSLPKADVLAAAAEDVDKKLGALVADCKAWNASQEDCFGAMILMTPTLSDYFEDWKESRYSKDKSGRFTAVSRISDMHGIMQSCAVMYRAVHPAVVQKDEGLGRAVNLGFDEIAAFLNKIQEREKAGEIKAAEIDELAAQAKSKTDKLVPQIQQAAAILDIKTNG